MLRNYLVTALRNMERNRLYTAISILGLAVAFAAAILIAQFVRGEFSYDRWIPGYERIYKITHAIERPGQARETGDDNPTPLAGQLRAALPHGATVARLLGDGPIVRHGSGDAGAQETAFAWAEPDFFKIFPLPVVGGDLQSALQQPDTVVLTRSMARKYFGRDLPIGDTLEIQLKDGRHRLRVTAVLKDLPSNTNFASEIFASSRSSFSGLSQWDAKRDIGDMINLIFVRLPPLATAQDLDRRLQTAGQPQVAVFVGMGGGTRLSFQAVPLAESHLYPLSFSAYAMKPAGSRSVAYAIAALGALIVLVAGINFVTLMTARAGRRAVEVGIRKAAGASRGQLVAQFIGEALIQVAISAALALALAEMLAKLFGALVLRDLKVDVLNDHVVMAGVAGAALCIGLISAIYPALVLSGFRPATVLKGGPLQASGSPAARRVLVVVQFVILVGLIVAAATVYRQTKFALDRVLGASISENTVLAYAPCDGPFPNMVRGLRGVSAVACSSGYALNPTSGKFVEPVQMRGGPQIVFDYADVDFGFFEFYGVKPVAGRLFSPAHGEDQALTDGRDRAFASVMINETGARMLGFAGRPSAAVGRTLILWRTGSGAPSSLPATIIGVVPNIPVTVRAVVNPTYYFVGAKKHLNTLSIKVSGNDLPATVRQIEAAWTRTAPSLPINTSFAGQSKLRLYRDLITQGEAVGLCADLAVLIACLGLFALSAFITERRTKEIGVRKAMGADTRDVVLLLLWQFSIPVLIAAAIAVPVGVAAMGWWLQGFAYHIALSAWTFVLATAVAIGVAWLTVSYQSVLAARSRPATALRYE